MLTEPMTVCNDHLNNPKDQPKKIEDFNVAAAVQTCIEALTRSDVLAQYEEKLKNEYKAIFEPILHINKLPKDVLAEIYVQQAKKMIKTCTYPSPWKYKEAWQILIQQHLDEFALVHLPPLCAKNEPECPPMLGK